MHGKRPIRRVACIGEVMIELIARQDGSAQLGVAGDTFNTAVYMARILGDVEVAYVTALGRDPYSDRIMAAARRYGLATDHIERRDGMMPGLYAIDTDAQGERSFSYWRSAAAARTLFTAPCEVGLDKLSGFDLVFLSGITLAILPPPVRAAILDWADGFRAAGGTLAYDSNHRAKLWQSAAVAREVNMAMWARADIALPSIDDEMDLFGDADETALLDRLAAAGAEHGALKRGAAGPRNLRDRSVLPDPTKVDRVIDSTAAGDSFNAGYLAATVRGEPEIEAMRAGHDLAARVVQAPGAIIEA